MTDRAGLVLALVVMGAGWGLTQPLTKIAVSTGYGHFGLIAWQLVVAILLTGGVLMMRGGIPALTRNRLPIVLVVAIFGTVVPNSASYQAAVHLPSGIMSILIATVPMFAFPMALALGIDRVSLRRVLGLCLGLAGVAMIAAPGTSLPDPAMLAFVPLALLAPLCYGLEGNAINRIGLAGLSALGVLFWASVAGLCMALPLALLTGQALPPAIYLTPQGQALAASGLLHVIVYTGYIWLVGRAGAVFAGQVAYLVTGFGVIWAMVILGESYSGWVWAALLAMLAGIALVRPRPQAGPDVPLALDQPEDETDPRHKSGQA